MPKVSVKKFQRRIAELDAQYTIARRKRPAGVAALRRALALVILALIAVAVFASAHRGTSEFSRLTLKQGTTAPKQQLSDDAEAQAKWNAVWGAATSGLKRGE